MRKICINIKKNDKNYKTILLLLTYDDTGAHALPFALYKVVLQQ